MCLLASVCPSVSQSALSRLKPSSQRVFKMVAHPAVNLILICVLFSIDWNTSMPVCHDMTLDVISGGTYCILLTPFQIIVFL